MNITRAQTPLYPLIEPNYLKEAKTLLNLGHIEEALKALSLITDDCVRLNYMAEFAKKIAAMGMVDKALELADLIPNTVKLIAYTEIVFLLDDNSILSRLTPEEIGTVKSCLYLGYPSGKGKPIGDYAFTGNYH